MILDYRAAARKRLDLQLSEGTLVERLNVPPGGWIREVRNAINMPLASLALRRRASAEATFKVEKAEQSRKITLEKMEEIGSALGCHFVYGFVPYGGSFEGLVRAQAEQKIATEGLESTPLSIIRTAAERGLWSEASHPKDLPPA